MPVEFQNWLAYQLGCICLPTGVFFMCLNSLSKKLASGMVKGFAGMLTNWGVYNVYYLYKVHMCIICILAWVLFYFSPEVAQI
jgi:hypothetical protein